MAVGLFNLDRVYSSVVVQFKVQYVCVLRGMVCIIFVNFFDEYEVVCIDLGLVVEGIVVGFYVDQVKLQVVVVVFGFIDVEFGVVVQFVQYYSYNVQVIIFIII